MGRGSMKVTHTGALLISFLTFAAGLTHAQSVFQVVRTPNENFNNGLLASSASSPDDIWAVGQSTIHFDGTQWTAFQAPMIHGDNTSQLDCFVATSPTEAWAAGLVHS